MDFRSPTLDKKRKTWNPWYSEVETPGFHSGTDCTFLVRLISRSANGVWGQAQRRPTKKWGWHFPPKRKCRRLLGSPQAAQLMAVSGDAAALSGPEPGAHMDHGSICHIHIQVARMPRIRHFMFRKFFEDAYEKHLSLRRHMGRIWEAYMSLREHMRGIAQWGDIWEASLIEETSERHLRGSGSEKTWFSFSFSYVSQTNLLKNIVFSNLLLNWHIKSIEFSMIC
jgi:hypothetical protein